MRLVYRTNEFPLFWSIKNYRLKDIPEKMRSIFPILKIFNRKLNCVAANKSKINSRIVTYLRNGKKTHKKTAFDNFYHFDIRALCIATFTDYYIILWIKHRSSFFSELFSIVNIWNPLMTNNKKHIHWIHLTCIKSHRCRQWQAFVSADRRERMWYVRHNFIYILSCALDSVLEKSEREHLQK